MVDCKSIMREFSRYLLVIFNLFFAITGIILISVGASVKAYCNEYSSFLDYKYLYASDLLIIIGIVIFFISFFGCCGAIKENACMTTTYSSLLLVILILEILAGIGAVLLKNKTESFLRDTLESTMAKYDTEQSEEITLIWDNIQSKFHCCGVDKADDWMNPAITNSTQGLIPLSCCDMPPGTVDHWTCTNTSLSIHREGCLTEFSDVVKGQAKTIEGVSLGLALAQVLGVILSCYLAKQIRSDYETV